MITRAEILMGRDAEYPLTPQLEFNLGQLFHAINQVRKLYNKPMSVSSGYRPGKYNTAAGGAQNSAHMTCEAIDISDPKGELDAWCMANQAKLEEYGLWLEEPTHTPGWCHLDIRPRNVRVFKP